MASFCSASVVSLRSVWYFSAMYVCAACPQAASMRRTPEAMALSDLMMKVPMSAVLLTCVPPQSSMEYPLSACGSPPIWTTRTVSPYLSPKNWVMSLRFLTFVWGTSFAETVLFWLMAVLTLFSSAWICSGVSAADEKSNLSLSGATSEPCCVASSETIWWSAQWRRWVAVWWDSMLRLCWSSMVRVMGCPGVMSGASVLWMRCAMAFPILMTLLMGVVLFEVLALPVSPFWPPIST